MAARHPSLGAARHNRGFALIIVLWAVVVIALIVIHLTASGRTELGIASNLAGNAAAQAAADGAVYQAIFNLLDPREDQRWPLDGSTRELHVGNSRVTLKLANEAARINPNLASPALLQALFTALGVNKEQAATLTKAIDEWVGGSKRPRNRTNSDDRAAGSAPTSPGKPLQSIDELAEVSGMTPELLELLRPHLTLFGPAAPDTVDDPVVAHALAEATGTVPDLAPRRAAAEDSGVLTARISATAHGPGKAMANVIAIARVDPSMPRGYALLAWENNAE